MTRDTRTLTSKHFPTEARLVRTLLNAEAADLLPAFTLTQQSPRHKLTMTGPAWAFSHLAARLRGLAACAKGEWNGAAKCYEKLADKVAAATPATEEPVAQEPVTVAQEPAPVEPAPLAPVALGTSPAGVEWNVYPRANETRDAFEARVQVARERLATLHAKHAPAAPVTEEPALTLDPVTIGVEGERTLYPRAGESAAVFHARVAQERDRMLGVTPAEEPTLHRDALAHLHQLDEVAYDYIVDAYAEAEDRALRRTAPAEWTEEQAEECLDCSALEDQDWHPPRTCDTWEDVYAVIREAYERAAS